MNDDRFAISEFAFQCPWCASVNDSMTAEWCTCVSSKPTLLCGSCGRCFCQATAEWRLSFLISPAAAAFRRRSLLIARTPVPRTAVSPEKPARPVILIVDDDKVVHLIAQRVLSDFGGTIVHAEDGETALRLARTLLPDLVITDALLPKLDGREFCRLLKSDPETRHCKVAVMTALYKGLRYRAEAFNTFLVDEYMEKPVTAVALRTLAANLLTQADSGKINPAAAMAVA